MAESQQNDFTSNDEIDNFTNGDTMISLKGVVAWVDGIKETNGGKKIFRFVMSNGTGRRVRLLVWESLSKIYQEKVKSKMVLSLTRLRCQSVDGRYDQEAENVIKQELVVSNQTKVIWPDTTGLADEIEQVLAFEDVPDTFGFAVMRGYVKDEFEEVTFKEYKFSSGSITDGNYKIKVQVRSFNKTLAAKLVPGVHVEIRGQIEREKSYALTYMQCNSFNDIKILGAEKMATAQLKAGFKSPESNPAKKRRVDLEVKDADGNGDDDQPMPGA